MPIWHCVHGLMVSAREDVRPSFGFFAPAPCLALFARGSSLISATVRISPREMAV